MTGGLDVKLRLQLPASDAARIRAKLPAPLAALAGAGGDQPMTIPLTLGGSASQPRIGVDESGVSTVLEEAAAARLAKEKAKLQESAASAATSLLQDLTGSRGKVSAEGGEKEKPAPTELLEKGLKDLGSGIGGLFGGKKKKKRDGE
jgi:hypothetical protein